MVNAMYINPQTIRIEEPPLCGTTHDPFRRKIMSGSTDSSPAIVNINAMRSRLVILGFNLAIATFQINNLRVLIGGRHVDGFIQNLHMSAGAVLLISIALSVASMIAFISSSALDSEASCDYRPLLAADLLMYLALSYTVTAFFSPYLYMLDIVPMLTPAEQADMSVVLKGMAVAGATAWMLATYVGPIVAFVHSPHGRVSKLLHAASYIVIQMCIAQLWVTALRLEGRTLTESGSLSSWLSAFVTPLFW